MKIGIPKEIEAHESRVAITPSVVPKLQALGYEVLVAAEAGINAHFTDTAYREAGAEIVDTPADLWSAADLILKIRPPTATETAWMRPGQSLVSLIWPAQQAALLQELQDKEVNVFAMDCVPRISRAQKIDVLSSMTNIAGYRAVIEAAHHFGRFFTGQITAAGKVPPAKVMVIGAGVAGLAAIGAANSLGAIVRAFDTRPEVKEQVESMGAEFLQLEFAGEEAAGSGGYAKTMSKEFIAAEMALFAAQAKEVDIIITTALIPGKTAPELITEDMLKDMQQGSVLIDLAAEQGGNCKLTVADEVIIKHGVTLVGHTNLPGLLPTQSSQLYANNIYHLLTEMTPEKNGQLMVNMQDEMIRGLTVIYDKKITWPPPAVAVSKAPATSPSPKALDPVAPAPTTARKICCRYLPMLLIGVPLLWLGSVAPPSFMADFTVFVLACFIGYMVIWNVSPALHTPLMSVTNAISSIIIIGALIQISSPLTLITVLAAVGILITSINITGGFMVTQRMLRMFRKLK